VLEHNFENKKPAAILTAAGFFISVIS